MEERKVSLRATIIISSALMSIPVAFVLSAIGKLDFGGHYPLVFSCNVDIAPHVNFHNQTKDCEEK